MIAQFLVLLVLPALLAAAAGFDLATFTIPNLISLALAAAFAVFAFAAGTSAHDLAFHLLAGLIALACWSAPPKRGPPSSTDSLPSGSRPCQRKRSTAAREPFSRSPKAG